MSEEVSNMVVADEISYNKKAGNGQFIPLHILRQLRHFLRDPCEGPCRFSCGSCALCILHEHLKKHRQHKAEKLMKS
jgi:hypothetical protein